MKNILLIFIKYGTHLLFIAFQIICFTLIVNNNKVHGDIYDNTKSIFFENFNNKVDQLSDYLKLDEQNDSLVRENAKLLDIIINQNNTSRTYTTTDSSLLQQYSFIPAEICNKTIHLRNNYFTLCAGSTNGVKPMMGVISAEGIVGITTRVSDHYSKVIPMLHSQSRISASIRGLAFFGNLVWKNNDPKIMTLEAVPKHAPISIGDLVVTSGYSSIFPKDLPIGTISNFEITKGSSNYVIDVKLFNDLNNLSYTYLVNNKLKEEKLNLENNIDE